MSRQRRMIVIDSDDEGNDNRSYNFSDDLKTPAARGVIDPCISASSHTILNDALAPPSSLQRGRVMMGVSKADGSGDEAELNGQQIINIMHGKNFPKFFRTRRSSRPEFGSTVLSTTTNQDLYQDTVAQAVGGASDVENILAVPRSATPQFTTSAAHACRNSGTPPVQKQQSSSRRSSRLAKGPGQDKIDLRRKLLDLRDLRSKGKMSIGSLHDSSSGSEDEEIQAMAAKHLSESKKRMDPHISRLDQHKDSSGDESDERVTRHFGRNEVKLADDEYDMSNFIVDDDYDDDDDDNEGGRRGSRSSRSRSKRGRRDKKKSQIKKRRVICDSNSDSESGSACESESESFHRPQGRRDGRSGNSPAVQQKRHRAEPVLQVVPERKRKRWVVDDEEDESEGVEGGEDKDGLDDRRGANYDAELSEDSSEVDVRRHRKKGKVQRMCLGGNLDSKISPLVTINSAKRGRKAREEKPTLRGKRMPNRKIVRDEDDEEDEVEGHVEGNGGDSSSELSDSSDSGVSSGTASEGEQADCGFSSHRQLDLLRQQHDDGEIEAVPTAMFRKSMCVSEALGVYIEMLLCILTDSEYCARYSECTDGALHVRMNISRGDQEQIQLHRSAARTVENLICTSRESLLGSSVWKGEFFRELTTRPFFDVRFTNTHDHTCGSKTDDRGKERGLERCDACGRENKSSGGYKLHLFGPVYDAPGLWNSRRWINKLPETIISSLRPYLTKTPSQSKTSSASSPRGADVSELCGSSGKTIFTPGRRQQVAAAENFKSDVKRMLYLQSGLKKSASMIEDDDDGDDEDDEEAGTLASPSVALSSALLKRVSISGHQPKHDWGQNESDSHTSDDDEETDDDDIDDQGDHASTPWWQRKWGKDLSNEPETKWVVNSHCKRRTQMYHTLLHYKFRLILKIRERVRLKALNDGPLSPIASSGGSKRGRIDGDGVKNVGDALGVGFIAAEVERFEGLLAMAGQQFGGEEHAKLSIWSDDEDDNEKRASRAAGCSKKSTSLSSSRQSSGSGGGCRGGRRTGPTLDGWLTTRSPATLGSVNKG